MLGCEAGVPCISRQKFIIPILCSHIFGILNLYLTDTQTPVWVLVGACRAEVSLHLEIIVDCPLQRADVLVIIYLFVCPSYILCLGVLFVNFFSGDVRLGCWAP